MNRRVQCARCGREEPLAHDEPGKVVQLPHKWKRVGHRNDGTPVLFCPACIAATGPANDEGVEP